MAQGTWNQCITPIRQQGDNILIQNPNSLAGVNSSITGGRIAFSGADPPGYINPINVRTTSQAMNIDSRFRKNYYNTSSGKFGIDLPDPQKGVVSLQLASLEIPLTHYAISAKQGNACMLVITNKPTSQTVWRVRLPDGHYENSALNITKAFSIEHAMNNALSLAEAGTLTNGIWTKTTPAPTEHLTKYVRYVVDHASARSTFAAVKTQEGSNTCTEDGAVSGFRFNVTHDGNIDTATNIQRRLGWQLGFRAAAYDAEAATSEAPCHITGPKYGFLAINDYQRNTGSTYIVSFAESTLNSNVIARFNLAYQISDIGSYQRTDSSSIANPFCAKREYFGPVNIQKLEFTLYDDLGNILDLNNCDWSCTLAFEKQYD